MDEKSWKASIIDKWISDSEDGGYATISEPENKDEPDNSQAEK